MKPISLQEQSFLCFDNNSQKQRTKQQQQHSRESAIGLIFLTIIERLVNVVNKAIVLSSKKNSRLHFWYHIWQSSCVPHSFYQFFNVWKQYIYMNCGRYFVSGSRKGEKTVATFCLKVKMILIVNVEVQVRKRVDDNYSFLHVAPHTVWKLQNSHNKRFYIYCEIVVSR